MERRIAALSQPKSARRSVWARLRDSHAAARTNLSKAPITSVWGAVLGILIFWIPFAWITAEHLATPFILDTRGVTVEATVDHRSYGRGAHSLEVRTLDEPQFSITLHHWPRDLEVGDRFELTYDPQQPTRASAEGTPWVDAVISEFVLLDLFFLPWGILLVPILGELARRARSGLVARTALKDSDGTPRSPLQDLRRGYRFAVHHLRDDARTQPRIMAFTLFLLIPGLVTLASGSFVVVQAAQAAALYQRGTSGMAIVDRTNMVSGPFEYADIQFAVNGSPDRTVRTTTTHLAEPHFEGTSLRIVYDPKHPENAIEAGAIPWGWAEWTATAVFIAAGAFAATSIPAAVPPLLRRTHERTDAR
ncbi:hypothetical protein [Promicromonospora panici]|uniref:hypothetical protein n=1 Tax=Promicromonospora panici TaxID=2219658 RepID=UPI001A92EDE5|nr:hypothetical protein [Promicromonospora panici]